MGTGDMSLAKAHANIALIKYWGKTDTKLALPATSSLSLTLDALYTTTEVRIDPMLTEDRFTLDGTVQGPRELQKISSFVDLFRVGNQHVEIISENNFPTAAGLASSASGYAALATALNDVFACGLDKTALSRLTRRGSGSASRSLFGGFAVWQKGDDLESLAYPLEETMDIQMVIAIVSDRQKARSSRSKMQETALQSRYFDAWVANNDTDMADMQAAIRAQDIHMVGRIAERNAMMMHATLLALDEPFFYMNPLSLRVIELVHEMRRDGLAAYVTMDAGPNVKIITDSKDSGEIYARLSALLGREQILVAKPGPQAEVLS